MPVCAQGLTVDPVIEGNGSSMMVDVSLPSSGILSDRVYVLNMASKRDGSTALVSLPFHDDRHAERIF